MITITNKIDCCGCNACGEKSNESYNLYMDRSVTDKQSEKFYLDNAIKKQMQFEGMRLKKLMFADEYKTAIQKYADWLGEYLKQNIRVMS